LNNQSSVLKSAANELLQEYLLEFY